MYREHKIHSVRDVAMHFGQYMKYSKHYESVTPYFLLQMFYQKWGENSQVLFDYCDLLEDMAETLSYKVVQGPVLATSCKYPDLPIPFSMLWHFDRSHEVASTKAADRFFPLVDQLHPDVIISCLLSLIDNGPVILETLTRKKKRNNLRLLCLSMHAEANCLRQKTSDTYSSISFKDLAKGKFPAIQIPYGYEPKSLLMVQVDGVDLLEVLNSILRLMDDVEDRRIETFIKSKIPSFTIVKGGNRDAHSIVMTAESRRETKTNWGREQWKIIVNGKVAWISPGQQEKLLAFIIAKMKPVDGIDGLVKSDPHIMGHPLDEYITIPARADNLRADVCDALSVEGLTRSQCIISVREPKPFYRLNWETDKLIILPLLDTHKSNNRHLLPKNIASLLDLLC